MNNKFQYLLEDFNPDGMTRDDIGRWIEFIGHGKRPSVANQWFPNTKGKFELVRNMRNYLWNKLTAMDLRIAGNIQKALEYEAICDRIYNEFPMEVRW